MLRSQIFPNEGSVLNYRIVGFSFPIQSNVNDYQLEIATGFFNSADSFKKNVIKREKNSTGKLLVEVPAFGAQYTWRVVHTKKAHGNKSEFHHFTTGILPAVDTAFYRVRVLKSAEAYKDAYFFLDRAKVLYNMAGEAVWYYPYGSTAGVSDLKLTPQGTITLLNNSLPLEVGYNADTLWMAPNGGVVNGEKTENYSHEFTRLNNGSYMVLGTEHALWELDARDSNLFNKRDQTIVRDENGRFFQKVDCGTIIEYDAQGKIIWSWKSSAYFSKGTTYKKKNAKGMYDFNGVGNSFYFDEEKSCVYFSVRPENSVLKIQYPEGAVSDVFIGRPQGNSAEGDGNDLFCGQHSCKLSPEGYLCLYNNNGCTPNGLPHVVMLAPSDVKNAAPKKIWDYECTIEAEANLIGKERIFKKGGNVVILPDSSFFISMCGSYSKANIVSRDKRVLWSVLPELRANAKSNWLPMSSYRASIITSRAKLEQLIWHTQK